MFGLPSLAIPAIAAAVIASVIGWALLERAGRQTAEAEAVTYRVAAEANLAALRETMAAHEASDLAFAGALARAMKLGAGIELLTKEVRDEETRGDDVVARIRAQRERLLQLSASGADQDGETAAGQGDAGTDSGAGSATDPLGR